MSKGAIRCAQRAVAGVALAALCAASADAITITYVNAGPLDSRVYVGFANDASGNLTSDFVANGSAASRNDTVYGPLPPIGDLPNFDAKAYASAELGTNLNAPLGTGVRSVFAPLTPSFLQAHGETLMASGSYSSHAYSFSGDTTATLPTRWIVHVDPSGAETAGTPADVTITGSLTGAVTVAGAATAAATWDVSTTGFGTVMSGAASQATPGSTPLSDSGSLTFTLPLGSTFDLLVSYDLTTAGGGAGANSTSEIGASLVQISAALSPPAMFAPISGFKLLMQDKYAAHGKAKMVLVAKDATAGSIDKGAAADPPGLVGSVELYQLSNPANRARYALAAPGWSANTAAAAKFKNSGAAAGAAGVLKALIKPDRSLTVVAKNLGDGDAASGDQNADDLDVTALTTSDVVMAVITIDNAADSSTHRLCARFESPTIKPIAGGTGVQYLSKTSTLPASCP